MQFSEKFLGATHSAKKCFSSPLLAGSAILFLPVRQQL